MGNPAGLLFGAKNLTKEEIFGKEVLDVGSFEQGISVRPLLKSWSPRRYVGVDIVAGPDVEEVCEVGNLLARFGAESFDVVVCMELLEHVRDWREAIGNLKGVCRPGGLLLITTRSRGFRYHGFPKDYWRYEEKDMREIFSDMDIEAMEKDPQPGIFAKIRKPMSFREISCADRQLYSIVANRRVKEFQTKDYYTPYCFGLMARELLGRTLWAVGRRLHRLAKP